ncbi:MAG: hypothetical protein JW941_06120 [Candidatus Coatesbacteria bacterium]|nr:hypothetical protein [Candidatus Coatesbacteria bacterium]
MAFYLSAVLFSVRYIRRGGIGSLLALSLSVLLALASKEFAMTMPIFIGLVLFLPFERPEEGTRGRILTALSISVALTVGYIVLRRALAFRTEFPQNTLSLLLKSAHGIFTILWSPLGYGLIGVLSALFVISCLFWARTRILALLVLLLLGPVFIQVPEMRNCYPASVPLSLMIATALRAFCERPRPKVAWYQAGLLIVLTCGILIAFVSQNGPSLPFVLGGLSLALILLAYGWRKGRIQASCLPSFALAAFIAASHFGLRWTFPGNARPAAEPWAHRGVSSINCPIESRSL